MENKDEYVVYTRNDNTKFYYKNKKLHRKSGPAVVISKDYDKYLKIGDESLYKKISESLYSSDFDDFVVKYLPNGDFVIVRDPPVYYLRSCYYLDGIEYTDQEFNAIILKEILDEKVIDPNQEYLQRTKV